MPWSPPRLTEADVVAIARNLPGMEHWDWEKHSSIKLEEDRRGRLIWSGSAGLLIDAMVRLMVDDETGMPLRCWVPGRGFFGCTYWLDSTRSESWHAFDAELKERAARKPARLTVGTALAAARDAVAAQGLDWTEPVCMKFDYQDGWHIVTNALRKQDNLWIEVRDSDGSIRRLAAYAERG